MKYESSYEKYYGVDPYNSGNTLKQHGIIGMKWGVWNEETRARYLGSGRRKSKSENALTGTKKVAGGLFNRGSRRDYSSLVKEDLSSLSEEEKKKIDKKYFKESTATIKTRVMDNNGRFTDKWITKKFKSYDIDAKKIVNDLSIDFYRKIDKEKKDFNRYEQDHLLEKKWVKALDEYWYGHDFTLNMFPVNITENEFKEEMKNYWAKGVDDQKIDLLYKYMVEKTKYSDAVESVCENEARRLGISDSMLNTAKYGLYGAFVDNMKNTHEQAQNLLHSDSFSNSYYGTDFSDPRTTAEHHGIIGQKWGVWNEETRARYLGLRKHKRKEGGSPWFTKVTELFSNKEKTKEEPHLKRTHLTKELSEISDAELNAAIKRMQLEQQYLNLLKQYPDASDKGRKYADQFSDELFKNLSNGLGGAMGRRIAKAIDSWFDDDNSDKEKKIRQEASRKSDDELRKKNARDALINQYTKNRLAEEKK